jgi:hypothetical protein
MVPDAAYVDQGKLPKSFTAKKSRFQDMDIFGHRMPSKPGYAYVLSLLPLVLNLGIGSSSLLDRKHLE